jgi:hypothetical protein
MGVMQSATQPSIPMVMLSHVTPRFWIELAWFTDRLTVDAR